MDCDVSAFIYGVIGTFILTFAGCVFVAECVRVPAAVNELKQQAIKHGSAQYNPSTAAFEWKDCTCQ